MTALKAWIRALDQIKKTADVVLPGQINQWAERHGERIALCSESDCLNYRDLAVRVNGYASWAIKHQIAGQTIALLMHNSADYVAIWLGLTRVGCKVALLNTSLRRDALLHCLRAVDANYLIGSDDLTAPLTGEIPILQQPSVADGIDLAVWPPPKPQDIALYIYTSGTTGLPKAAKITHRRITEWSYWFAGIVNAQIDDRLYNCLPMYHSIGGIVAIGSMLVVGGSVVIRQRFSASSFWPDVKTHGCTIFQYIGELCRYLLQSSGEHDKHQLRLAVGNGLQSDVWQKFQDRFAIPQILEYYAATEGVLSLYNCEGKPGAIGRIPPALEPYFAVRLIKVDDSGEPLRDAAGCCIAAEQGEPGEAISLIRSGRSFDGYNDSEASNRKVLANVFMTGDHWYRSGDLMRRDAEGFFYFVDRLGDTFRWKGENVSTTEVANVIRECPGVLDAIVYGVHVPGFEGRAGMAAITTTVGFSLVALTEHLDAALPSYARPIYLRFCTALEATGTYKLTKGKFTDEGYARASDPVYMRRETKFVRRGHDD